MFRHLTQAAAGLALTVAVLTMTTRSSAETDPLAGHRWRDRVIVAFAESRSDRRLAEQKHAIAAMGGAALERDLVLVEAIGAEPQARALRRRFDIPDGGFRAVLVGKDGGAKLVSAEPLTAAELVPIIDAMPMRRQEIRR